MSGSMRDRMPVSAAFIDEMRAVFGDADINTQLKRGMCGEPTFWAKEGGSEIGTKVSEEGWRTLAWE